MSLDLQFAFLDDLPESLYQRVVTLHHGSLRARVTGVLLWRHALLRGELPQLSQLHWPERPFAETILQRLAALDVVSLCRHQEPLVDQIIQDICLAIESLLRREAQGITSLFDDTLSASNERKSESPSGDGEMGEGDARGDVDQSSATSAAADELANPQTADQPADRDSSAAITTSASTADPLRGMSDEVYAQLGDELTQHWQQVLDHWHKTSAVFQDMSSTLGRGWDLSSGDLHDTGWQQFVAYRKLLRRHPQLLAIVDSLGREMTAVDEGATTENTASTPEAATDIAHVEQRVHTESPLSTRGISRSDDIARMLPQEAAFLGHPRLKMLWHARRAEQGLLSYQFDGVRSEHQPELLRQELQDEQPKSHSERQRGPLIICLDSSASMHGRPEDIAKAVCLEVLRLANETDRACHLFVFSGPGQVIDLPLRFTPVGLREILRFLSQSFHGGTDIREPIMRALEKLHHPQWRRADMLLITDGRFPVPDAVAQAVDDAREKDGLRLQGLLIGRWTSPTLGRICRPLHRFQLPSALVGMT